MTAKLFTLPKQVPVTNANALIPGAKAYFYVNGTSTLQDVYTTSALNIAHDNPVIADGFGKFPTIYFDNTKNYKVKLTDNSNPEVELYSEDAFNPIPSASSVGSSLWPQTSDELGQGVTPTNYEYPPGNVLRYGADNTGVTDSTSAIQDAIDSSLYVLIPEGTYLCQSALNLRTGSSIDGTGTLKTDGTNSLFSAVGTLGTLSEITANVSRGDTTFAAATGTGSSYTAGSGYFIQGEKYPLGHASHKAGEIGIVESVSTDTVTVENLLLDNYESVQATISGATQANPCVVTATAHGFTDGTRVDIAGVVGMTELNGNTYTVANKTANTFELSGVDSTGYTAYTSDGTADTDALAAPITFIENISIQGVTLTNDTYTTGTTTQTSPLIYLEFVRDFEVSANTLTENNSSGVSAFNCLNGTINGNTFSRMRNDAGNSILGYGVQTGFNSQNIAVTGNSFRDCRHAFTTGTGSVSSLTPNYGVQRGINVSGNSVTNCTSIGIDTHEDSDGVTISGNTVVGCISAGIQSRSYGTSITGNTVIACKGKGIRNSSTSLDTVITGNVIRDIVINSSDGFGIEGDGKSTNISGNTITGCESDGIHIGANALRFVTITGNEVKNNGGDGINIDRAGVLSRLTVTGNTCSDDQGTKTQRYGCAIESGTTTSTSNCIIANNNFTGNLTGAFNNGGTGAPILRNNVGHVTENSGTGSITSGGTTDVITHGLSDTPSAENIQITLTEDPTNTPGAIFVDTITSTQFTVNCENDPGVSNLDFGWQAVIV